MTGSERNSYSLGITMELRHLRYFITVAEEGHITRAAERLGMQQPPLSRQIKEIERQVDVQLFVRKARGVELTDAGRAFLDEARAILAKIEQAVETTRRTARGEQGRICVGVTPTGAFLPFVPRVIRAFREAFPRVSVTLEESLSPELIEHLRNEQIDVAFLRTPIADAEALLVMPLLEEPLVVALPSAHALAQSNRGRDVALSVKALAGETFIVYGRPRKPGEHGLGQYEAMIAACHAAGFSPRIGQEAPRISSTLSLVAVGLGICLIPASLARMNMDGVTYRRLKGTNQPKAIVHLASRRGDRSAVVRHFLNLVKRAAKNSVVD
jgi:DNA-binding transcriptional LysR family regulator